MHAFGVHNTPMLSHCFLVFRVPRPDGNVVPLIMPHPGWSSHGERTTPLSLHLTEVSPCRHALHPHLHFFSSANCRCSSGVVGWGIPALYIEGPLLYNHKPQPIRDPIDQWIGLLFKWPNHSDPTESSKGCKALQPVFFLILVHSSVSSTFS